jgi:hypothetical protein
MRRLIASPKQTPHRTTLLSLFHTYDVNPAASYKICIGGGLARGVVEQSDEECESEYACGESYNSYEYEEVSVRRGVGLFANIIRNMEIRRQQEEVKQVAKLPAKEYKEYQFYYPKNVLENCINQPKKAEETKNSPFSRMEVVQPNIPSPPKVDAVPAPAPSRWKSSK